MSESYDAKGTLEKTFFSHLLLESDTAKIMEITGQPDFDSSKMEVNLTINGYPLRIQDFNEIMDDWGNRVEKQIKEKFDVLALECAVEDKAHELIKERLGDINEKLYDFEQYMADKLADWD